MRGLAVSSQMSAHHRLTLASPCTSMPPRPSICSLSALGLPIIFCLFFENKFIVFIKKATEGHYRESKSEKQRQKPDQLQPPLPAPTPPPGCGSLQLAFSDAGFYFCLLVIIVSGQFWVLLSPICFFGSSFLCGHGVWAISVFNGCGMVWGWGWDRVAEPHPAVPQWARLVTCCPGLPVLFVSVCLYLDLPRCQGLPPGVPLLQHPLSQCPFVELTRLASGAIFLGKDHGQICVQI